MSATTNFGKGQPEDLAMISPQRFGEKPGNTPIAGMSPRVPSVVG